MWKLIGSIIGTIVLVLGAFAAIITLTDRGKKAYDAYYHAHIHTYPCYDKFIKGYKIEIPKYPGITVVVYLETMFSKPLSKPESREILKALSSLFQSRVLAGATNYAKLIESEKKCIMRERENMKEDSAILLSEIEEKDTNLGFFATKDSVDVAKKTIRNIFNNNNKTLTSYDFEKYGNVIMLKADNNGVVTGTGFEYKFGGNSPLKAKTAFENISNEKRESYCDIGENNETEHASICFPLIVDDFTRNICMKCHLLGNANSAKIDNIN